MPASVNENSKMPSLIILNLAYAPEHRAKWEKHQRSASQAN